MHRITRALLLTILSLSYSGCQAAAIRSAPRKVPQLATSPEALAAKEHFRTAFEDGDYAALDRALLAELTAAYLRSPDDPVLALYLGHAHLWRLAERNRDPALGPLVTDQAALAALYFSQASALAPGDDRIAGWLGGAKLALGSIQHDERERREGYFLLKDGADRYPEFNLFSMSYAMGQLSPRDPRFPEVLEAMWRSMDVCADAQVDRRHPDYSPYMALEKKDDPQGRRRVCWDEKRAPHNFEGFFLHNGDLLTKAGDADAARVMYANARLSDRYAEWPYREVLEQRLRTVDARAAAFRSDDQTSWPEMMATSEQSCSGCHQR